MDRAAPRAPAVTLLLNFFALSPADRNPAWNFVASSEIRL
jgi:hypothetical protein